MINIDGLNDEHFIDLFACMPNLRNFHLKNDGPIALSLAKFIAMGESCPKLVNLMMNARFDLRALPLTSPPLFPCLKLLKLNEALPGNFDKFERLGKWVAKVEKLLHNHMPRLKSLFLYDGWNIRNILLEYTFGQRVEEKDSAAPLPSVQR
ncbi:hypothetical protein K470DRAFT_290545 [Piedraia hortae CBS 480.64]|uniref:F-box domain-containing protein n=1 Tax=Piedraia hortae CBS 480.64 TaxID=1314780 RepID=A0A6A7C671_9PEZI|nr:hypothetical protein K470DRAFT_290545 [Piedraia hortae CBS 480.64]